MKKKLFVVAGVITHDKKILCVQRGFNKYEYISKKFEFPGGKIEKNERYKDALKREIIEELSMDIEIKKFIMTVEHKYPDFFLNMKVFLCSTENKSLSLSEHISYKWLKLSNLGKLDWAAADIPVAKKLLSKGIF